MEGWGGGEENHLKVTQSNRIIARTNDFLLWGKKKDMK